MFPFAITFDQGGWRQRSEADLMINYTSTAYRYYGTNEGVRKTNIVH
jgi:hypothetical protein